VFLDNYLDSNHLNMIYNNYRLDYLNSLDEDNFKIIYYLLLKYDIKNIDDLIVKYLEIFSLDKDTVIKGLERLKFMLGSNYVDLINENITYFNELFN